MGTHRLSLNDYSRPSIRNIKEWMDEVEKTESGKDKLNMKQALEGMMIKLRIQWNQVIPINLSRFCSLPLLLHFYSFNFSSIVPSPPCFVSDTYINFIFSLLSTHTAPTSLPPRHPLYFRPSYALHFHTSLTQRNYVRM